MRDRIVAIGATLLVLSVVAVGAWTLLGREEPDPAAEAAAVIDDYLAAWERWDVGSMARHLLEPDDGFRRLHLEMEQALAPAATTLERQPIRLDGGQAETEVTVTLDLPYADRFAYATTLVVQRSRGEWGVLFGPETLHPDLVDGFTWRVDTEEATRAPILAHDGSALTSPGDLHTIGLWPARMEDPDDVQAAFDTHAPDGSDEVEELLGDELNPDWFYPVVTLRAERFESAWAELSSVPGIVQRTSEERLTPTDGFALHVLGAVETLDEAAAAELGPPYETGDEVGRYGLEAALEEELRGSGVVRIVLAEPDGEIHLVVHEFEGDPAEPVTTTLGRDVQRAAENALVGASGNLAIVAVDTATGAIRAAASRPLTGYNRVFEARYPPGSTFKIVTAAAALADGWGPEDEVDCPAEVSVGGRRIRNLGGFALGAVTLERAFAASCNTSFALLADELGAAALEEAAERFGFGADYALALPSFGASFPTPADEAEQAEAAIGQGRVEVSAVHLASVAAAVAADGWRPPALLESALPTSPGADLPAGVAADLRQLMRAVVTDGTGTAAALDGEPVHGKTGSAETVADGSAVTHAWFVGFRGDLAVAVLVEGGGSGGEVAAPLAARFFREVAASGP